MKTRVISTEIWDSDDVYVLNIDTKLLYLILLTNPYIGQNRFYKINDRQLSTFSGLNIDQIQKCKKDLELSKMAFFKDGYVCVTGTGFIESFYKGEKNAIARAKEEMSIPKEIVSFFYSKLNELGIIEEQKRIDSAIVRERTYGRKKMTNTRRTRLLGMLGSKCNLCGTEDALFEIDHIIPLHLGGTETDDNLQVLCTDCHIEKTSSENMKISNSLSEISDSTINTKSEILNNKSYSIFDDIEVIPDPEMPKGEWKIVNVGINDIYSSEFEEFWKAYPKKVGKGGAWKSWKKIKPLPNSKNGLLEKILNKIGIQAQSVQWKRDNGQFIPHPTTYLNQRRWEDEEVEIITNKVQHF